MKVVKLRLKADIYVAAIGTGGDDLLYPSGVLEALAIQAVEKSLNSVNPTKVMNYSNPNQPQKITMDFTIHSRVHLISPEAPVTKLHDVKKD